MKIWDFFSFCNTENIKPFLTIGMFDGVHKGHTNLIEKVNNEAKKQGGQSFVVTFKQHPQKIVRKKSPPLITPFKKKLELLEQLEVDHCLMIDFNSQTMKITAEDFIEQHLVKKVKLAKIIIGENFHFGYKNSGNYEVLKKMSERFGYEVEAVNLNQFQGINISSSNIRKAILDGDMKKAQEMLGRPFSLIGNVIPGLQRGRTLGYPTANINMHHELIPQEGVYCGYTYVENLKYPALISIGRCTTFEPHTEVKVEVYLMDYEGNLYEQELETFISEKIREQESYLSKEALTEQIKKDERYLRENLKVIL